MKLLPHLSNQNLLRGLYLLALISPLTVIAAPLYLVINLTYRGYFFFFLGFFSFVVAINSKPDSEQLTTVLKKAGHYLGLLLPGLLMIFGLGLLTVDENRQSPLYLTLATCTLHGLLNSRRIQDSVYLLIALQISFLSLLIFTGFSSIGFSAYYGAAGFALALACTFTAPQLLVQLSQQAQSVSTDTLEIRTRKQRRRFRNITNHLASITTWRWFMIALLLLGPVIIATISMTALFPQEFGGIVLLLVIARFVVQPLPVKGPVPVINSALIREWTLFCYLFVLSILLLRLVLIK